MILGTVLKEWRWARKLGIRAAAKEIGVSPSTLSRIERGENMDGQTLAHIIAWLLKMV
jgi:transcriptional regulator with XRE-family HTH domain